MCLHCLLGVNVRQSHLCIHMFSTCPTPFGVYIQYYQPNIQLCHHKTGQFCAELLRRKNILLIYINYTKQKAYCFKSQLISNFNWNEKYQYTPHFLPVESFVCSPLHRQLSWIHFAWAWPASSQSWSDLHTVENDCSSETMCLVCLIMGYCQIYHEA